MYLVVQKVTGNRLETEEVLYDRADLTQHSCYQAAVNHYKHNCFNWHRQEVGLSEHDCEQGSSKMENHKTGSARRVITTASELHNWEITCFVPYV